MIAKQNFYFIDTFRNKKRIHEEKKSGIVNLFFHALYLHEKQ